MFYYVYILQNSKNSRWYTGTTSNLRKRFKEHTEGRSRYTKGKGQYTLIYYEACLEKQDAWSREQYLKSGMGKRYIKNRIKRFLSLTG